MVLTVTDEEALVAGMVGWVGVLRFSGTGLLPAEVEVSGRLALAVSVAVEGSEDNDVAEVDHSTSTFDAETFS